MSFEANIKGLPELIKALEQWPDIVRPILQETANTALLSLIPDLADYPPAPVQSHYRRTGTLGRLWTSAKPEFAPLSTGFEARIGNKTRYGLWVQGPKGQRPGQAKQHQGRWKTTEAIVKAHQAEIDAYFERAMERVIEAIDAATS